MSENIGQQLHQAREKRSLSLEQVAQATHIRVHYLRALENGDFTSMPSTAQARGFLRTYADFLRLDSVALLECLNGEAQPAAVADLPLSASGSLERPVSFEEADAIFAAIGQELKNQRERLGLSLDDVVRHTHLRHHYLAALEAGKLDDLPSPVQGRGMLSNYATFLGMDPEKVLLRFAEGLQARLAVKQAARGEVKTRPVERRPLPPFLQRLLSAELLIGIAFILGLVAFVVWGSVRIFAMRSEQVVSPTAPSIVDVLLAAPSAMPTLAPETATPPAVAGQSFPLAAGAGEGTETPQLTLPPGGNGEVVVYITIRQRAWLRVTVDGKVEFEGRVIPGSAYSYNGEERVELLTGNGAALQVFYNQEDLGVLGTYGQVVNRVFTVEGIQTPTPSPTLTPTATPRQSATPQATETSALLQTPTAPALP